MANEKFCLRWNDFASNIGVAFRELREDQEFFDVTLACDEDQIQAHKVILSACSPFFRRILQRNPHPHPVLYLKGVKLSNLLSILDFMYHGEVNLAQADLNLFLEVAEELKVKGLTQKQSSKMPESGVANQPREHVASPGPDLNSNIGKSPPTSVHKPKRQPLPHIEDDTVLVKSVPDEAPLYHQSWPGDETEEQHDDIEEKHEIEDLGHYEGGGYDTWYSGGGDGGFDSNQTLSTTCSSLLFVSKGVTNAPVAVSAIQARCPSSVTLRANTFPTTLSGIVMFVESSLKPRKHLGSISVVPMARVN